MIRFILNEKEVTNTLPPGMVVLDFIRHHQHSMGTKIGGREGDCGACTILVGEINNNELAYRSMTSCLMPIGNAHGKHIVTIEGVNHADVLNAVQKAMADEGATQCGFCTPGFVMSLAGFCLSNKEATQQNVIAAVDGNICRCTGYKSIERAAGGVGAGLSALLNAQLVNGIDHFLSITGFDTELEKADLVITGEGSLDIQTLQGKGPFGVAKKAKEKDIPVIGVAGKIPSETSIGLQKYFDVLLSINHQAMELSEALPHTRTNLIRTAKTIGDRLALKK